MTVRRHRESWWIDGLYRDETDSYRYDGEMTAEQFEKARHDLGRNEGPALLFDLWYTGSIDLHESPGVVAAVWTMAEFPASAFDPPTMWVDLFDEAGFTRDGLPAQRPDKPVTVYRGCHHDRRFGMSWTTDLDRARWFAARGPKTGNVYTVDAQPQWLLAYIHEWGRREAEYVIDPQYLSDDVVVRLE